MMEVVERFLEKTNFDALIKQALEKDILSISKNTDETIRGFGLCTNWTIDMSPSEFWLTALLTEEGVDELEEESMYSTGSWDGFDQGGDSEASEITDKIYAEMWEAHKGQDDDSEFYELIRKRCAEILVSCIPLIKEHFKTTDDFFVSIAEHDEDVEAQERMLTVTGA